MKKSTKTQKTNRESEVSEPIPTVMKVIAVFMLLMIPILGYFILRSDPIIYSNNVTKNDSTVKQVQAFAAFIQQKPEMAIRPITPQSLANFAQNSAMPANPRVTKVFTPEAKEKGREMVSELQGFWRDHPPTYDQQWRNQVEKLFDVVEQSGNEEGLDLIRSQMLLGRTHSDDLNREQSNRWFSRYVELESRADKLRETAELFSEKVLERLDKDERALREQQSH